MKRLAILHPSAARYCPQARLGMTLIEVLIATALTLVIMLALAQGFKTLSQGVTAGRSRLTGSDQLRGMSSLLRADLAGMTANIRQMPNTQQAANGYFEYYDGPLSDSTAMLYNYVPTATTPEEQLSASRWSDIDDVLMFTAKAKDGQWFRGRVPLALLKIHQRNVTGNTNIQPTLQDWLTDVSVASEYAEIVWFMRPLNGVGGLDVTGTEMAENGVIDIASVVDRTGDGVPDPDGMPDRIALCRRVMLIRPDLNITPNLSEITLPANDLLACRPAPDPLYPGSNRTLMRYPNQRCDLSVRAVREPNSNRFLLRTNSLADLQVPSNRFAHYTLSVNHPNFGQSESLPVLALTEEPNVEDPPSSGVFPRREYRLMVSAAYGDFFQPNQYPSQPVFPGFIPGSFFRTKIDADSNGKIVYVRPTLEEVIASNIVGFDVRGYDGVVQQLASPGSDGLWGASGNVADAGAPGTDDLVVTPSDPGYAVQIATNSVVPINTGAFVDLCWGRRVVCQLADSTTTPAILGGVAALDALSVNDPRRSLFNTPLSGFESYFDTSENRFRFRVPLAMQKSSRFTPRIPFELIYQPTFDTFTDFYESDGKWQINGFMPVNQTQLSDQGIDGIDSNANGAIDEELELETRPPIVYPMPAIQVKFRIQDVPAGTLQEISMVHDLMGN